MYGTSSTSSPKPTTSASPSSSSSSGPSTTPATLAYFCIFNPEFGPTDETQHEQLLYYMARKTVSIDVKMRNIGLAQGLVNFARIFSPTAPCENVHSQKNRLVFLEAEPGYWLHMSIELGTIKRSIKGADGKYRVITEYLEHEIHDTVLSALLKQAYGMYKVAHGTMDSLVNANEGNTRPLQRRLEEFFEPWVQSWGDFEKTMTLERALDGISYLPLSKGAYTNVERLVKSVRDKYSDLITHSMVTFEDLLVSSDIRDEDLREVWKHVVQTTGHDGASALAAWEKKEEEETRKRKGTAGSSPRPSGESEILLPSNGKAQLNPLWFGQDSASEDVDEHFGIIYKHKSGLNLCFFAPVNIQESQRLMDEPDQFTRELEDFISGLIYDPPFLDPNESATRSLMENVSKQIAKDANTARSLGGTLASDKEIRFLYFNKMNLAIKVQLGSPSGKGGIMMGSEMALSLLDIKQDFDRMPDASEITTRSPSNHWIVGKRLEDREVYMIVSRKDSTMVEVEDELHKLTSLYFNNNGTLSTPSSSASSAGASPRVE
ncbi:vacuolar fusion protein ccz1 [Mortierella sp. AD010]|nr:vacuolar fusion protein ccz1 [Mortierella sp. AD010]